MLKQRVITAFALAAAVLTGVFFLSGEALALAVGAFLTLGAWEWAAFAGLARAPARVLYAACVGLLFWVAWQASAHPAWLVALLGATLLWWLGALALVARFAGAAAPRRGFGWGAALAGGIVLVPAGVAVAVLHARFGPGFVVFLLALNAAADIGAYFAGRRWGRRRLAPRVSPGKTWEGVGGALAASTLLSLGVALLVLRLGPGAAFALVGVCLSAVAFSVVGDLVESLFKRCRGLKDSGSLLPGHGGVLDRIDSLTAAAPVFVLGLLGWEAMR